MSQVVDIHKKNGIRADFDVYIGRRIQYHDEFVEDSKWRNRSKTLQDYEQWVRDTLWDDLDGLKGKILGCWCVNTVLFFPLSCHGQVLMRLVKEKGNIDAGCRYICKRCAEGFHEMPISHGHCFMTLYPNEPRPTKFCGGEVVRVRG